MGYTSCILDLREGTYGHHCQQEGSGCQIAIATRHPPTTQVVYGG